VLTALRSDYYKSMGEKKTNCLSSTGKGLFQIVCMGIIGDILEIYVKYVFIAFLA
jgi:hypothetical protein